MSNCLIDRLPSELLSQIFVILNEASIYARSIGDTSYGTADYPPLLSSVCSRWRHIAISTPYLWSYLSCTTPENEQQWLERVDRYLHRGQNTPLRVRIGTFINEWPREEVDSSFEFLLRSSGPRLESLTISYWHSSFVKQAISMLFSEGETSSVTRLALFTYATRGKRILADGEFLPQEHLDRLFEPLQSLHLDSVSPDWDRLACRNLVELQLIDPPTGGAPSVQQLVNVLRANPGLRSIRFIMFPYPLGTLEHNLRPIELPYLQELDLRVDPGFANWLLGLLVPGSYDLAINFASLWSELDYPDITGAFLDFSRRARIVSLHVSGSCLLVHRLYDYLPHLRTLQLSSQTMESLFTGLHEAAHPLPLLHTFELLSCTHDVGSQWGPQAMRKLPSLKRVRFRQFGLYVDGKRVSSEEVVEWVKRGCGDSEIEVVDSPELDFSAYGYSPFRE